MNIILNPDQFLLDRVIFLDSRPNKMIDGHFTKINYSDEIFTMQCLFFELTPHSAPWLVLFEKRLITYYLENKPRTNCRTFEDYKLQNFIQQTAHFTGSCLIKISGIWENSAGELGLSFRIIDV